MFGTTFENLETPLSELFCRNCKANIVPAWQIRLTAAECGQAADIIGFHCSACGLDDYTPDDLSVLDAETIEGL